jgi:hypothetical protein
VRSGCEVLASMCNPSRSTEWDPFDGPTESSLRTE